MVEEPLQDSIRTPSDTAGGFVKSFDNIDSKILAQETERERAQSQESERERAQSQKSERERAPTQEFEREQALNTSIQLDSRKVRTIGMYSGGPR
jgi:F0F1-type ATP synthase epsilon subunit